MVTVQFVGGDLHGVLQVLESCGCKSVRILHAQTRKRLTVFNVEIDMETKEKLDCLNRLVQ